jgi:hypothetical protein
MIVELRVSGDQNAFRGVQRFRGRREVRRTLSENHDVPLPMHARVVREVAAAAEIGLAGIEVQLEEDQQWRARGVYGYCDPYGEVIILFPDAFENEEQLVRTLAHERIQQPSHECMVLRAIVLMPRPVSWPRLIARRSGGSSIATSTESPRLVRRVVGHVSRGPYRAA